MGKYTNEFKLKVVRYYLDGHSYTECSEKFRIPSFTPIRQWVHRYELYGAEGVMKQLKSSYDGNFKQTVVEYMHNNHLSATETANHFRLGGSTVIYKWERIYYEEGPQGLYKDRRGRSRNMSSKSKKKLDKQIEEDLISENQRLKMEIEYLKKLNALVQERIKRENKKK